MENKTWFDLIPAQARDLAEELAGRAAAEVQKGKTIYPEQSKIFRALYVTPPEKTKVVLVGQDPYINPGQAEGLCFSVAPGAYPPPSLQNVFKELVSDIGCRYPSSGSLLPWAEQGVLLLNTTLTVERGRSNSHASWGWDRVTREIFKAAYFLPQPVVFIAWGRSAQNALYGLQFPNIKMKKALLKSPHPSPYSADSGFFGSKPFSKTNLLLDAMGAAPVNWQLP